MRDLFVRMMEKVGIADKSPAYEEARELARHADSTVRRKLAARTDTRPEILYYLAGDASPDVRCEIAANESTPVPAHLILAHDKDGRVRCELSAKIGKLLPHLSADAQSRLRDVTIEVLEILARDELERVRRILAETLKDVANAPPQVIRWLARDMEISVAAPVLQFSPLLTDNDLAEIIESDPVQGVLVAISRRSGLSASLCDAVVTTDDRQAIEQLLENPSAKMREETLDYVVERSRDVPAWQPPLVRHARLPRRLASKLAEFIAESLLAVLRQRRDFPPEVMEEIATVVRRRVAAGDLSPSAAGEPAVSGASRDSPAAGVVQDAAAAATDNAAAKAASAADAVRQLHALGRLDEEAIDAALFEGNESFVLCALALLSSQPLSLVKRVFAAQSAKGITALAWKAGLSMRFGIKLQVRLGRIAPGAILNAINGTDYPLTPKEMDWMIGFFNE